MSTPAYHTFTDEDWARSLVGRDWEIFWSENSGDADTDTNEAAAQGSENDDALGHTDNGRHEEEHEEQSDEEDDGDMTDWYEARVIAATKRDQEGFWFQVMFAGDDTVYDMTLIPSIVRPSARAWVKRSTALLSIPRNSLDQNEKQSNVDMALWEKDLPHGTVAISDLRRIAELRKGVSLEFLGDRSHHDSMSNTWDNATATTGKMGTPFPSHSERDDILHLIFLLRVQVYLQSKLAPMGEHKGKAKTENGEIIPTGTYVDFMVKCLEDLEKACCWYCKCWSLHHKVLPRPETVVTNDMQGRSTIAASFTNSTPPPAHQQSVATSNSNNHCHSTTPSLIPSNSQPNGHSLSPSGSVVTDRNGSNSCNALYDITFVSRDCLETGSDMIISLCNVNLSAEGACYQKRANPAAAGTRRTKRRKAGKGTGPVIAWEVGSNDGDELESGDERSFGRLSSESLRRFVNHTQQDCRWYMNYMTRMLLSICDHIYDPIKSWKLSAESILGDLPEKEDGDESDEESSVDSADGNNEDGNSSQDPGENPNVFTYDDVRSCIESSANDDLLRRFDLSPWTSRLKEKMIGISSFESNGWKLMSRVLEEPGEATKESDEVLNGLKSLKETSLSPSSHVRNVNPLGSSASQLTRIVLDDAITVRTWVLDLRHTEICRERLAFVQKIVSQAAKLPHIPSPQHTGSPVVPNSTTSQLGRMMIRAQSLSSKLFPHIETLSQYDHIVSIEVISPGKGARLRTTPEVLQAFNDLCSIPVVSPAEEKLAARLDVLQWMEKARLNARDKTPAYHDVVTLKEDLDQLLDGSSPTRLRLVSGLEPNKEADEEIREFVKSDVAALCGDTASMAESLYASSTEWKHRAEAIITALRAHGNTSAGEPIRSCKLPAMVDLKRITDLLSEKEGLGVIMPKQYSSILADVVEEVDTWSASTENAILDAPDPLDSLPLLMTARETRPKGVLMDPARHVVDSWIDVLDWHRRLKLSLEDLPNITSGLSGVSSVEDDFAKFEAGSVYPLLAEGIDLVVLFSQSLKQEGSIRFNFEQISSLMSKLQLTQRPTRLISQRKLESGSPGRKILEYIADSSCDESHGSPIFCLLFVVWRLMVIDFVRRHAEQLALSSGHSQMPSLQEAKQLNSSRPSLPETPKESDRVGHQHINYLRKIFIIAKTAEVQKFEQLISTGDKAEQQARTVLQSLKKLLRELPQQQDLICDHLSKLKALQGTFKSQSHLALNRDIEDTLDKTVKDLGWLVRTFPYDALHTDEISSVGSEVHSENKKEQGSEPNGTPNIRQKKVPWDVLVSLSERIPVSSELGEYNVGGVFARVAFRVRELYEAAHAWQEKVSSFMSISFRGMKRRVPSGGVTSPQKPTYSSAESESQPTVDFRTLDRLSRDPILAWVSMPRQAAVVEIVQKAREFEARQRDLLDKDYEGGTPDRARLPKAGSLVGKNGVFPLYRLTGSGLYTALQESLKSVATVGSEVLAQTPGKTTFIFITKAVSWIDRLRHSVTDHSPFEETAVKKLVIPFHDARKLLEEGQALFLEVPEDVRKTLSKHKIGISTNKQTAKLTVVIAKGGAHHSIGGTVLRWCPFLLESLKADISKLSAWKASVKATAEAVKCVTAKSFTGVNVDPDACYHWFRLREKLDMILEEGRDSLVVAPEPTFLKSVLDLKHAFDTWANKALCLPNESIDVDTLLARRYEDGATVVEDRFLLLDSLLGRSRLNRNKRKLSDISDVTAVIPENFRDKTRAVFERAFRKGMQMAGIDGSTLNQADSTIDSYCAIKARELERAIHSKMQGKSVGKAMSSGYREKVRSLRYNLEDIKNPTLCARVLLGNISVESLVSMSSEQLASKDLQRTRAKAQEESTKNFVIAPGPQKSASAAKATMESKGGPVKSKTIGSVGSFLKATLKSPSLDVTPTAQSRKKIMAASPVPSVAKLGGTQGTSKASQSLQSPGTPKVPSEGGAVRQQKSKDSTSPRFASPPSLNRLLQSVSSPPLVVPAPPSPPRMPPPPLVQLPPDSVPFAATANDRASMHSPVSSRTMLANVSGGDRFTFTFSNPKISFMAGMYLEDKRYCGLNGVLPEVLSVKGRLKIEEFSRFISDLDALEYKKFYKDYEGKKRIAMIAIGKETKLFLVTPLFHGAAKHLCESFSSRTSTYAVVLTKERFD